MTIYDTMALAVPDGVHGDVEIRRYEITARQAALSGLGSRNRGGTEPGTYVGMFRGGRLWMSDTAQEKLDALPFLRKAAAMRARRVLVNGLGLGMVLAALLRFEQVEHIDVVEIDPGVIALVGPHYEQMAAAAGKTLAIRQDNAYSVGWPRGVRWDAAWHDVWLNLCLDNLPQVTRLHRRYGGRVTHQDSWGRDWLVEGARRQRRQGRRERPRPASLRQSFS